MAQQFKIDGSSLPSAFQLTWQSNPDPTALPFRREDPPFPLTSIDWKQLNLTDAEFTPHSWENLQYLISNGQLDELKRWPSSLKAYLAWTGHVKEKYENVTAYLLQQRLYWTPVEKDDAGLSFKIQCPTPFENPEDYKILMNDWPYAFEPGIRHIVVWLKGRLPVDKNGALDEMGKKQVDDFVKWKFRTMVGEKRVDSQVLWFKNTTNLQSVRSLEHVHVLVRDVDEDLLKRWTEEMHDSDLDG